MSKILHVNVANKVATYQNRDGAIVCGNSDYLLEFSFDEEWAAYQKKTARFEWAGKYEDVEFEGDTCQVPVIKNTTKVFVGVYVGEEPEDESMLSSTRCEIPCNLSVRCGAPAAHDETGANYTNEARGYAASAKESAERAEEAAEQAANAGGMQEVGSVTFKTGEEEYDGDADAWHTTENYIEGEFITLVKDEAGSVTERNFAHSLINLFMNSKHIEISIKNYLYDGSIGYHSYFDTCSGGILYGGDHMYENPTEVLRCGWYIETSAYDWQSMNDIGDGVDVGAWLHIPKEIATRYSGIFTITFTGYN